MGRRWDNWDPGGVACNGAAQRSEETGVVVAHVPPCRCHTCREGSCCCKPKGFGPTNVTVYAIIRPGNAGADPQGTHSLHQEVAGWAGHQRVSEAPAAERPQALILYLLYGRVSCNVVRSLHPLHKPSAGFFAIWEGRALGCMADTARFCCTTCTDMILAGIGGVAKTGAASPSPGASGSARWMSSAARRRSSKCGTGVCS